MTNRSRPANLPRAPRKGWLAWALAVATLKAAADFLDALAVLAGCCC